MRNDYSKFTLIEMLRSYAEGIEEGTLGGNQRLDAADHIEALEATITELREFVETVEGALGGATGDDIRVHIGPALAALKQEVSDG